LPIMLDEQTRLESIVYANKVIAQKITLLKYNSEMLESVDPTYMEKYLYNEINNTVCKSEDMQMIIDNGFTYQYLYHGNDGILITNIFFNSYLCE
ncbi:hypothetical protein, partial [Vibrio sp.]|uniref:hypothetical protein n=1 Tax=Vibrio sp. TaxID=678 RepID=UPI003D141011